MSRATGSRRRRTKGAAPRAATAAAGPAPSWPPPWTSARSPWSPRDPAWWRRGVVSVGPRCLLHDGAPSSSPSRPPSSSGWPSSTTLLVWLSAAALPRCPLCLALYLRAMLTPGRRAEPRARATPHLRLSLSLSLPADSFISFCFGICL